MKDFKYREQGSAGRGALLFLKIYYRKFWRLAAVNVLYFIAVFPLAGVGYGVMAVKFRDGLTGADVLVSLLSYLPGPVLLFAVIISALVYGPLKMGVTYVYKCFFTGEHVYVTDVCVYALSNAKQGLAFGCLDLTVTAVLMYNIFNDLSLSGWMGTALDMARYISMTMLGMYVMIRHYFYLMAVSGEFRIGEVIKNSILLSVLKLGRSLGLCMACGVVWGVTLLSVPAVTVIFVPFAVYSVCGMMTVMLCWPSIDDYVVNR